MKKLTKPDLQLHDLTAYKTVYQCPFCDKPNDCGEIRCDINYESQYYAYDTNTEPWVERLALSWFYLHHSCTGINEDILSDLSAEADIRNYNEFINFMLDFFNSELCVELVKQEIIKQL